MPWALVIGKVFYKTDIRNYGSGNLGGGNAGRVLGKKAGLGTMALDRIYMSQESVSARQAAFYTDFSQFVARYQVRGDDGQSIAHKVRDMIDACARAERLYDVDGVEG